jgi:hypothetical protein
VGETPVVDVGQVLGPLAGEEIIVFIEAGQPVVRVFLPDYQVRRFFLAYGESAFYLEDLLVHCASTSPCSMSHPNDSLTACSEL